MHSMRTSRSTDAPGNTLGVRTAHRFLCFFRLHILTFDLDRTPRNPGFFAVHNTKHQNITAQLR